MIFCFTFKVGLIGLIKSGVPSKMDALPLNSDLSPPQLSLAIPVDSRIAAGVIGVKGLVLSILCGGGLAKVTEPVVPTVSIDMIYMGCGPGTCLLYTSPSPRDS